MASQLAGIASIRARANELLTLGNVDVEAEIRKLENELPVQARATLISLRAYDADPIQWEWLPI